MMSTFSIVTIDGTHMDEATLCAFHYCRVDRLAQAGLAAHEAGDAARPLSWVVSTGNTAVACIACPR